MSVDDDNGIERGLRNSVAGQAHHWSKWIDAEVRWIVALRAEGKSYTEIAKIMEMPRSTVAAICRGDIRPGIFLRQ